MYSMRESNQYGLPVYGVRESNQYGAPNVYSVRGSNKQYGAPDV